MNKVILLIIAYSESEVLTSPPGSTHLNLKSKLSFDESKRMSEESTEDFQKLYEDLEIKFYSERLVNNIQNPICI